MVSDIQYVAEAWNNGSSLEVAPKVNKYSSAKCFIEQQVNTFDCSFENLVNQWKLNCLCAGHV